LVLGVKVVVTFPTTGLPFSRTGCFEPHQAAAVGKVKLPADPHQRVTLLHQKTVAQIKRRIRIERRRRPVESVEHVLTATVENVKQRNAVTV
jgi:hypothetical protein